MRFERSKELYERAKESLAGGVSSHFRAVSRPVPLFFRGGEGARIIDVDGNEYIDYVLGQGPLIFGHSPAFLLEAVIREMKKGQVYAGQHELEVSVSEMVQEMVPCAELVRYSNSGSEVVHASLRLARAFTGRQKFIKFEGHYHGWFDDVMVSVSPALEQAGAYESPCPVPWSAGQSPRVLEDVIVLPWNNAELLRRAVESHADELAAIITEPIMCNTNCILPRPGFLETMRELCERYGIMLIFDEVITGFRVAPGGAQQHLDVTPDLAVFGKAMAGGFPLSMLAGKRSFMQLVADGKVIHAGTLNSNVMVMAAANASLSKLQANNGASYKHLYSVGEALMNGIRERASRRGHDVLVQGLEPMFNVQFTSQKEVYDYRSHLACDAQKLAHFTQLLLERGVRIIGRGMWYVSTAHTDEDVEATLRAVDESFAAL